MWTTVTYCKSSHGKQHKLRTQGQKRNPCIHAQPLPKTFWDHIINEFGKVWIEDEYEEDVYHTSIPLLEETKQIVFSMEGKFIPKDTGRHNRTYRLNSRVIMLIFEPKNFSQSGQSFEAMINIDSKTWLFDTRLAFKDARIYKNALELKEMADSFIK